MEKSEQVLEPPIVRNIEDDPGRDLWLQTRNVLIKLLPKTRPFCDEFMPPNLGYSKGFCRNITAKDAVY